MANWTVEDTLEITLEGVEASSIRLVGGEVSVAAGEGPARLVVKDVEHVPVEISLEDGELSITQAMPRKRRSGSGWLNFSFSIGSLRESPRATIELIVPAATRLEVATVSADIAVAGLSEPVKLRTVSGDVAAKDLSERVEVKTVSGDLDAVGLSGDLRLASVSGDLTVGRCDTRWVNARTVSGDIALDLDLSAGTYELASVSGDIALRVPPEDPSVSIELASVSGDFENEWGIDAGSPGRRRFTHTLGAGDATLRVKTVSGDLRIVRRAAAA